MKNGSLSRENGPALIHSSGEYSWNYQNNYLMIESDKLYSFRLTNDSFMDTLYQYYPGLRNL